MNEQTADKLSKMSPAQRAALLQRLSQTQRESARQIVPVPRDSSSHPIAPAQERLWFVEQLWPNTALHNVPVAVRILGEVNSERMQQAFVALAQRHEVLRTNFTHTNGAPVQVVRPATACAEFEMPVIDLSHLSHEAALCAAQDHARREAEMPFNLATDWLLRCKLLRLGPNDHMQLITLHHLVCDAWSLQILVKEFWELYKRCSYPSQPEPLPKLPFQYVDYAQHQRATSYQHQLAYWKSKLTDAPVLSLPLDMPRQAAQGQPGATQTIELPASLVEQLKRVGQAHQATLYHIMLAALSVLVAAYTGHDDVLIGSAVAGRTLPGLEALIGFFTNIVVFRTRLTHYTTFVDLLAAARREMLAALEHQDVPIDRLIQALGTGRDAGRQNLFPVAMTYRDTVQAANYVDGVTFELHEPHNGTCKMDLIFDFVAGPAQMKIVAEYRTDLFHSATIAHMLGALASVLQRVAANPDCPLSALYALPDEDLDALAQRCMPEPVPFAAGRAVHQLFEDMAAAQPDAVALVCESAQVSYAGLNAQAERIASHIRSRMPQQAGVANPIVGICLERGPNLVATVLGVMKAGAAYLPLDPAYPPERLAYMLVDAQAALVLAQASTVQCVAHAAQHNACTILLSEEIYKADALAGLEPERTSAPSADALAYIIYTSGSTGKPKGVMVPHGGLCNVVAAQQRMLGLGRTSRVLQFASISFDASIFEILMGLGSGGALVLATNTSAILGAALANFLQAQCVSLVTLPPSTLATVPHRALPYLRTITVAGEACPANVQQFWARDRQFVNLYGPTEATIWSTAFVCAGSDDIPPIGWPIQNTTALVVDAALRPVPPGVAGELCIGGVGVTQGYLRQPSLTAEKFVPSPFGPPGARMYRTGDVVRCRPDGCLEFLGRIDHQVKVRGYRIELGEIEATLGQHPAVRHAAVALREVIPGEKQLVAYVVYQREGAEIADAHHTQLKSFLQARLPQYMVPALFVSLKEMPLTPNQKIARDQLPAPRPNHPAQPSRPPRTLAEQTLAGIWREALSLSEVSLDQTFFELGGSSLLLAKVHARLVEAGFEALALLDLFLHPTITALAQHLDAQTQPLLANAPIAPSTPIGQARANTRLEMARRQRESRLLQLLQRA